MSFLYKKATQKRAILTRLIKIMTSGKKKNMPLSLVYKMILQLVYKMILQLVYKMILQLVYKMILQLVYKMILQLVYKMIPKKEILKKILKKDIKKMMTIERRAGMYIRSTKTTSVWRVLFKLKY